MYIYKKFSFGKNPAGRRVGFDLCPESFGQIGSLNFHNNPMIGIY